MIIVPIDGEFFLFNYMKMYFFAKNRQVWLLARGLKMVFVVAVFYL